MATDNDAEKLRKQINVLSSLIRSHQELKVKEKDSKTNYSWKKNDINSNLKPDSNSLRKYNSVKSENTSKQSTFSLDRRKQTSTKPLVTTAHSTTHSSRYKSSVAIEQAPLSKKGKNSLNKYVVISKSELKWKNDGKDKSNVSKTVNADQQKPSSSAQTASLSARLSSLSSTIATAKLKLQGSSNNGNVSKKGPLSTLCTVASSSAKKSNNSYSSASSFSSLASAVTSSSINKSINSLSSTSSFSSLASSTAASSSINKSINSLSSASSFSSLASSTAASSSINKSINSLSSTSSTYTWVKSESGQKGTNSNTQRISNPSSALKWTKDTGVSSMVKTSSVSSSNPSVYRRKGSLKLDRRKRSSVGTKQRNSGGFIKRQQKVVQKDTSKKNISSRFHYINSKRRSATASERKKTKVKTIEGVCYKMSANKLQKVKTKTTKKAKQKSSKLLNISGNNYLMDATKKTLKRVQPDDESQPTTSRPTDFSALKRKSSLSKVVVGGTVFTKTSSGVLLRSNPASRSLASHVRRRSVQNALLYKYRKNAKSQQYCMFYNRFGKCNKGIDCPYIHDPSKVAVCTKFLQGKCKKTDGSCSFSHKIDKDKLPVCQFFLKGTCTNDDCPYSHVNVSSNAAVCQDFIKGYCPDGQQCKKKHIVDCEEFLLTGKCTKGKKCNLMHRVRKPGKTKRKSSAKDPEQTSKQAKVVMTEEEGFLPLQALQDEPTVKEESGTDVKKKEKVQAIAIKPRFLINKDSQG